MESSPAIVVSGLNKSFGSLKALCEVSFSVLRGEIFAYLGPNGAGKTTTIKILSGLLDRNAGEVSICGADVAQNPVFVKERIGVVPDESNLYPELTCRRNLEYLGELYGLPRPARTYRAEELLTFFELADRAATPFGALSRGLKRRLTIAAALVHNPEVVFLDEPTSGLDVPSARALRELIRTINQQGATVFLTTHNLSEAETLSQRVLILIQGRVAAQGTPEEIRQRVQRLNLLAVTFSPEIEADQLLRTCPAVLKTSSQNGAWRLEVAESQAALEQLVAFARSEGVRIAEIHTITPSLEDAFMSFFDEGSPEAEA
ncbi:MAG: ABC transporter ATP-binding protein [Deltaproteobacteria bacterium]|nr:ABC transporter ATP-binding protein [Deltaproteobacteria bacterium]MBW1952975.1 ABC transporter ATP-binding protein [Deltaproteobacteria bacterium]MBW1987755.1 ABC transporter ATP-binding protein [Deltaproteobacteria bacterium]